MNGVNFFVTIILHPSRLYSLLALTFMIIIFDYSSEQYFYRTLERKVRGRHNVFFSELYHLERFRLVYSNDVVCLHWLSVSRGY
jgi:hypothetical protein